LRENDPANHSKLSQDHNFIPTTKSSRRMKILADTLTAYTLRDIPCKLLKRGLMHSVSISNWLCLQMAIINI
jgi:hypothetical protein